MKRSNICDESSFVVQLLRNDLNLAVEERTSIICEMIPEEIWKNIFQLLAHKKEISKVFNLKAVCKRWAHYFPDAFTEVTIRKFRSLNEINSLRSIRSLRIEKSNIITKEIFTSIFLKLDHLAIFSSLRSNFPLDNMIQQMTNLKSLKIHKLKKNDYLFNSNTIPLLTNLQSLKLGPISGSVNFIKFIKNFVHLKELDLRREIYLGYMLSDCQTFFGPNFEILDYLKELKVFTISIQSRKSFLNINELQQRYSHIRFRWIFESIYEGSFNNNNNMRHGFGKIKYARGDIYEGELKEDVLEGKGILYSRSGDHYEGDFSHDQKDGKGIMYFSNGEKYEGEYRNNFIHGKGIYNYINGDQFEGDFVRGVKEGRGIMKYSSGDKYEGEYQNDKREGKGVLSFANGSQFVGHFSNDEMVT